MIKGSKAAADMRIVAKGLIAVVALAHVGFLVPEMFFWDHPIGRKIFNMTPEVSASSAVLAANQGLYNGFLAAGLIWALVSDRRDLKLFFLGCVIVAGVFGAATAKITILFTQALPAALRSLRYSRRNRPTRSSHDHRHRQHPGAARDVRGDPRPRLAARRALARHFADAQAKAFVAVVRPLAAEVPTIDIFDATRVSPREL